MNLIKEIKKGEELPLYVKLINGLMGLTDKESEFLVLLLENNMKDPSTILSTYNRKQIMEKMKINKNNLSGYIKTLKLKAILLQSKETQEYKLNSLVTPEVHRGLINISFTIVIK